MSTFSTMSASDVRWIIRNLNTAMEYTWRENGGWNDEVRFYLDRARAALLEAALMPLAVEVATPAVEPFPAPLESAIGEL